MSLPNSEPTKSEPAKSEPAKNERRWLVAYTLPRHEKQVSLRMQRQSLECFLPLYESVRKWKTGPTEVSLPLFPGYIFVHADLQERRKVIELPSVLQVLGNRFGESVLSDMEIDQLRRTVASKRAQPHPYLSVGMRARIISGPLSGVEGLLVRKKGSLKVVLTVELVQQSVAIEVDSCDVEPCKPARTAAA